MGLVHPIFSYDKYMDSRAHLQPTLLNGNRLMMLGFATSDWRIRRNWTWSNRDMTKTCLQFCRAFRTIPRPHTHASINVDTVALQIESTICPWFRGCKSTSECMRRRLGAPRKSLLLSVNHSIEKCKTWEVGIRHEKEIWRVAREAFIREFAHAPNCVGALRTSYGVFPLICAESRDTDGSTRDYVLLCWSLSYLLAEP